MGIRVLEVIMFKSIKFRYTLTYSLLIISVIIFLSSFYFIVFTDIIAVKQFESKINIALSTASDISSQFRNHIASLETESHRIPLDIKQQDILIRNLRLLSESDDYFFINISFKNTQDITVSSNRFMPDFDADLTSSKLNSYILSGPYFETNSNIPLMIISVPVYNDSEYLGKLSGYIDLNLIHHELSSFSEWIDGSVNLLNQEGIILVDSTQTIHEYKNSNYLNINDEEEYDIIIDSFGEDGFAIIDYYDVNKNEEMIMTIVTLDNTPNWMLTISNTTDNIFEEVYDYGFLIIASGFIVLLITLIITKLLTNKTIKPIVNLTRAAEQKKLAEITKNIKKRKDEIYSLYNSFNDMTDALIKHSEELEELVEERTKELNDANERLYNLATTDNLTGAMNRMQIIDKLENIMYNIKDFKNVSFSILFIDLNNFKYYNDNFGHDIGDMLLIEVIDFLASQIRSNDFLGRYGGDEFIIIYPNMSSEITPKVIDKLIEAMELTNGFESQLAEWTQRDIHIPANKKLGLSIGAATYVSGSNESVDNLIKRADKAMYEMKTRIKASYKL